jgi:hypothetical protein
LNKLFLILITLLFSASAFAADSGPISFTKKEIAFFKWGTGKNEVKLVKTEEENIIHGTDEGGKRYSYRWPHSLKLDGNDNIYFGGGNGRIFIVSADGKSIKTINGEKTGGLGGVDGEGDIYAAYYKKDKNEFDLIVTKPDGTQKIYENFDPIYEDNGIVYNNGKSKAITITDNGDKPEKRPPSLMQGDKSDYMKKYPNTFTIFTEKINQHLKKINRQIDIDKIQIKIEGKGRLHLISDFIGVDDNPNFYFFCGFSPGPGINDPWEAACVMVYSSSGEKISQVPLELDSLNGQTSGGEVGLDIQGNIFHKWANKDGIHILKWTKN